MIFVILAVVLSALLLWHLNNRPAKHSVKPLRTYSNWTYLAWIAFIAFMVFSAILYYGGV